MNVSVRCSCGVTFTVAPWRARRGEVRYCSRPCMYRFRVVAQNGGQFKPGDRPSPDTEFKPGCRSNPAGEFKPGHRASPETEFKPGNVPHNWKGDSVGYDALHSWVSRHYGRPDTCEECGRTGAPIDWANRSGEYRRDRDDWLALCKRCHKAHDSGPNYGNSTRAFGPDGKRLVTT